MFENARRWGLLAGALSGAAACVVGFAGTIASAEPSYPQPPTPAPMAGARQIGMTPIAGAPAGVAAAAPVAAQNTIVPASSGTLVDFLKEKHVTLEPQVSKGFTALNIVLPMPTGWTHVPDPNVPDAFAVIADRVGGDGLYSSNAALIVYKLVGGEFDPKEAISHGLIDTQQLTAWRPTDASLADFGGMPSAAIEGTYRQNNMTLNTSRRHLLATSGPDKYLVSLSVTTSAGVSVAASTATNAILTGFRVTSPDAPPPAVPAPAVPTPAAAPAALPPAAPAAPAAAPTAMPLIHQMLVLPR